MAGTQNRGQLAHFIAKSEAVNYDRMAKGFSDMASNLNPQTREVTYIDDSSDSTTTGFQVSYPVSGNYYDEDPANMLLFDMAVNLVKGPDAVLSMLEAHLWREHETVPGVYEGFKQGCTWVPESSGGGAGGDTVTYSGSLNVKGDRVHGWVAIDKTTTPWTATFSEDEPE
ncbi:hypothetical protein C4J81_13735 [Deltaproteobacteria bacterium Smac51]|nr:hypothetical protein C4J81_13735 [Deltaproteobacteria bacterium Smac51]